MNGDLRRSINCLFFYVSILQKQSKDRFGLDGDEEATMLEESVSPKKSVLMFRLPMMLCFEKAVIPSECLLVTLVIAL